MPPRGYVPILEQIRIGTKDGEIIGVLHNTAGILAFEDLWITKVIFNDPATIVLWKDGTKTVVKCQKGDTYDPEKGLAFCIIKKIFGNKGKFNDIFRQWIPKNDTPKVEKTTSETDFCGKFTENAPEREHTRGRARKVDVGKIYALHKAHWSAEKIADEMGISVATVYKYLREIKETRGHNRYHTEINV